MSDLPLITISFMAINLITMAYALYIYIKAVVVHYQLLQPL